MLPHGVRLSELSVLDVRVLLLLAFVGCIMADWWSSARQEGGYGAAFKEEGSCALPTPGTTL